MSAEDDLESVNAGIERSRFPEEPVVRAPADDRLAPDQDHLHGGGAEPKGEHIAPTSGLGLPNQLVPSACCGLSKIAVRTNVPRRHWSLRLN